MAQGSQVEIMSQMVQTHRELWAKSPEKSRNIVGDGESLLQHSINITTVARQVCRQLPFPNEERTQIEGVLVQAAAFHDLGKAATGFQCMLRERSFIWKHRHETLSTALAYALNPQLDPCALFAVLTHHRSIPDDGIAGEGEKCLPPTELPPDFNGLFESKDWQQMLAELRENWEALRDVVIRLARVLKHPLAELSPDTPLLELGIEPAWLDRRARKQRTIPDEQKWRASLLRGLLITSDHMASAIDPRTRAHPKPLEIPRLADYSDLIKEKELPKDESLLPFQRRTADTGGDAILKAPTGSGKTLAALLWGTRNQVENGRFFYVLPYTASINAMSDRLKRIFDAKFADEEKNQGRVDDSLVGVLHHRNADYLFRSMEEEESAQQRNKSARHLSSLAREMYHPIRVCTPHQILRFALCGRGWETGLSEFPRACFVFDEVHAFEPLLAGLTLATVRLLKRMNAHVLFASATIPRFLEAIIKSEISIDNANVIAPDPSDNLDAAVCDRVRHRIEVRSGSLLDSLPRIIDEIRTSRETALIACNHVATSQNVFRQLRDEFDAMLLHSRFNGRDRNRIEQAITSKGKPTVLVATQAVEVSLDIDYDRGYTEPAPADALGQRFGRINRKGNRPQPAPVVVFAQPSAGYLYDQTLTDKTIELLRAIGDLTEGQLTDLVDQVYGAGYPPAAMEDFNNGNENPHVNNFENQIIAGVHRQWTDEILDQSDGQLDILPDSLLDEFLELREQKRFIEAAQLLVPIRAGQKFKALRMDALRYDQNFREFIATLGYSSEIGLMFDERSSTVF
jgi:CRISPR-associated endonuclease/helicase Cas3